MLVATLVQGLFYNSISHVVGEVVPLAYLSIVTAQHGSDPYPKNTFRVHTLDNLGCRWKNDGMDQELAYFEEGPNGRMTGFEVLSMPFVRID